jgi:hypothetical protein
MRAGIIQVLEFYTQYYYSVLTTDRIDDTSVRARKSVYLLYEK